MSNRFVHPFVANDSKTPALRTFGAAVAAMWLLTASVSMVGCGSDDQPAKGPDVTEDAEQDVGKVEDGGSNAGECEINADCKGTVGPCERFICDTATKTCVKSKKPTGAICEDGDKCTTNTCTDAGDCNIQVKTCQQDGNPCTVSACKKDTGSCGVTNAADGAACDDGNKCTQNDSCKAGACTPGNDICACNKSKPCPDPDGDPCTGVHYCDQSDADPTKWSCKLNQGSIIKCADDGNACTVIACSKATGKCETTNIPDKPTAKACDDGLPCTTGDFCKGGKCVAGTSTCCQADADCVKYEAGIKDKCKGSKMYCNKTSGQCLVNPASKVVCSTLNDSACAINTCSPKTGKCAMVNALNGVGCKDDNPCTGGTACQGGKCTGGINICTCKSDDDCTSKEDDTLCNGALFCDKTFIDKKSGKITPSCVVNPATIVKCSPSDKDCHTNTCNPGTGICKLKKDAPKTSCLDGNPCTTSDECDKDGKCVGGKNVCECENDAECAKFEDGNKCNGTLYCNKKAKNEKGAISPQCEINPATIVSCKSAGNTECKKNVCDITTGKCGVEFFQFQGDSCSDGSPCTLNDTCDAGKCKAGPNLCECEPGTKSQTCDSFEDGDLCNGTMYCDAKKLPYKCRVNPSTIVKCKTDKDNQCQVNICDKTKGSCGIVYKNVDQPCDDGNKCTTTEVCKSGVCAVPGLGSKNPCDDGNTCTTDACSQAKGCTYTKQSGIKCTDGDACTEGDVCTNGACKPGKPKNCSDGNECTTNLCHSKAGCQSFLNSKFCEDGNKCTLKDSCVGGKCTSGKLKTCQDANPCNLDVCNTSSGNCEFKNAAPSVVCDDGFACTTEACSSSGGCSWKPNSAVCSDGHDCTIDACEIGKGCTHAPNHKACDKNEPCRVYSCQLGVGCKAANEIDGNACSDGKNCTFPDSCKGGKCQAGPKVPGCDADPTQCKGKALGTACKTGDQCTTGECVNDTCRAKTVSTHLALVTGSGYSSPLYDGYRDRVRHSGPIEVAAAPDGRIFVSEHLGHAIRVVDKRQRGRLYAGSAQRASGSNDGTAMGARFKQPWGIALDQVGQLLVADAGNSRIRRITKGTDTGRQVITLAGSSVGFADGKGSSAKFNSPRGVAMRSDGKLVVADKGNHVVRLVAADGTVSTLAGNKKDEYKAGKGTAAGIGQPSAVAVGPKGNIFVGTYGTNGRVMRIDTAGNVSLLAGGASKPANGKGTVAGFQQIHGLAVDAHGVVFASDAAYPYRTTRIRSVWPDGTVKPMYGRYSTTFKTGPMKSAMLYRPFGMAIDASGNLVVAVYNAHRLARIELRKTKCDDGKQCTIDACDPQTGKCSVKPGTICDDGLFPCRTPATCNESTGACAWKSKANGTDCADGLACTTVHNCQSGHCQPAAKVGVYAGTTAPKSGHGVSSLDGTIKSALFHAPMGMVNDGKGGVIVADSNNHMIRRITPEGNVVTLAGNNIIGANFADGKAHAARFNRPIGVAMLPDGAIYISDSKNHRIRKLSTDGVVTTVAGSTKYGAKDGKGAAASFNQPHGIATDSAGILYVADCYSHKVRRVAQDGTVTRLAGVSSGWLDGPISVARLRYPADVAVGPDQAVYVTESSHYQAAIRRVKDGVVSTIVGGAAQGDNPGDGVGHAFIRGITGIDIDATGVIYAAEFGNHQVRVIYPTGEVRTLAGQGRYGNGLADGVGAAVKFNGPWDVLLTKQGLLVSDYYNHRIRLVTLPTKVCDDKNACTADSCHNSLGCIHPPLPTTVKCDDGQACTVGDRCSAGKCSPGKKATNCKCKSGPAGGCDDGNACTIDSCDPSTGCVATAVNEGTACNDGNACTTGEACRNGKCTARERWILDRVTWQYGRRDGHRRPLAGIDKANPNHRASFQVQGPRGIAFGPNGALYVASEQSHGIKRLDKDGWGTTIAGMARRTYNHGHRNGTATGAQFYAPFDVGVDATGAVYVADYNNHVIRKIVGDTVSTLAGKAGKAGYKDGKGADAQFYYPHSVAVDPVGNVYVADRSNCVIRHVAPDGAVSTLIGKKGVCLTAAGTAAAARVRYPTAVRFGPDGYLYVATDGHMIMRVSTTGDTEIIAGQPGTYNRGGYRDGITPFGARFNNPRGLAIDKAGNIFVAEGANRRIRMITAPSPTGRRVLTIAGTGAYGNVLGFGDKAQLRRPNGIALAPDGSLYITDWDNHYIGRLRRVGASCDDGNACTKDVCDPKKGCKHDKSPLAEACPDGGECSVATCDAKTGRCSYKIAVNGTLCGGKGDCGKQCYGGLCQSSGVVTSVAGTGANALVDGPAHKASFRGPIGLAMASDGTRFVVDHASHAVRKVDKNGAVTTWVGNNGYGYQEGGIKQAKFRYPWAVQVDAKNNLYISDRDNNRIRRTKPDRVTVTLAGGIPGFKDGTKTAARFNRPTGMRIGPDGHLYVADTNNHIIRRIELATGKVTTFAGTPTKYQWVDGPKEKAWFRSPMAIDFDKSGDAFVVDTGNHCIRRISKTGLTTTIAGYWAAGMVVGKGRQSSSFLTPHDVLALNDGSLLVTGRGSRVIRRVWMDGTTTSIGGRASTAGYNNGLGHEARLGGPMVLLRDGTSNRIWFTDYETRRLRVIDLGLSTCAELRGVSKHNAGSSCKAIKPLAKYADPGAYWVDPDGGSTDNAFRTQCDMNTAGGGWTRVVETIDGEVVDKLRGKSGRVLYKCAHVGTEHAISPSTSSKWSWFKKTAVKGQWTVNGAKVACADDKASFDKIECGFGYGCSNGAKSDDAQLLPGLRFTGKAYQCVQPNTQTTYWNTTMTARGPMLTCKKDGTTDKNGNYTRYWVYVRDDN